MSCVDAAASELIAPECVLIVAASTAASSSPTSPCGIWSTMNVGKIASGVGNVAAAVERPQPDAEHQEERELEDHRDAAADDRRLRRRERLAPTAAAAR